MVKRRRSDGGQPVSVRSVPEASTSVPLLLQPGATPGYCSEGDLPVGSRCYALLLA